MLKVDTIELQIGQPLRWSVYDENGNLMRREGFILQNQAQLEQLTRRPLFRLGSDDERPTRRGPSRQRESKPEPLFDALEFLASKIARIHNALALEHTDAWIARELSEVATRLQDMVEQDTDAALASLHLEEAGRYDTTHPLHAGMLCEIIGKRLELSEGERLSAIQAALTCDLGLISLRNIVNYQHGPLTPGQWAEVRRHPTIGAHLLRHAGIKDDEWIETVLNHHERLDGSGYPQGLKGDYIPLPARILALADSYSAMVVQRPYREALISKQALRDLFTQRGSLIDAQIAEIFVKELGIYPPGTLVRLENGETAVVMRRGKNVAQPLLRALVDGNGKLLPRPLERDPTQPEFTIKDTVPLTRRLVQLARPLWK